VQLNGQNLILLPIEDTKANYLSGFWRWVDYLASDNYELAIESLYWTQPPAWTPDKLRQRICSFFGGNEPWVPIIPNQRVINVINDVTEMRPRNKEGWGWVMAQIPVTTQPRAPKDDKIPLMGLATSFFIREHEGKYVLDFEIFHL
jgi:hypothetical protein